MKKFIIGGLVLIVLALVVFSGCSDLSTQMNKQYNQVAVQMDKFQSNQPAPEIDFSNTRQAVIDRIERWSDPNKISYIYLVSFGRVMAFYTVKGSVESKQSYLYPVYYPYSGGSVALDNPDVDGTYGDNMDSIFFFTTEGVYVEWHGDYLWVDQPLKFTTAPELYMEIEN